MTRELSPKGFGVSKQLNSCNGDWGFSKQKKIQQLAGMGLKVVQNNVRIIPRVLWSRQWWPVSPGSAPGLEGDRRSKLKMGNMLPVTSQHSGS